MNANIKLYEELELLPPGSLARAKRTAILGSLVAHLVQALTGATEPRIKSHTDQNGQTRFDAHDPVAQRSVYGLSEEGLRVWLERRYQNSASHQ